MYVVFVKCCSEILKSCRFEGSPFFRLALTRKSNFFNVIFFLNIHYGRLPIVSTDSSETTDQLLQFPAHAATRLLQKLKTSFNFVLPWPLPVEILSVCLPA